MPRVTIAYGTALIVLGVGVYFQTGLKSLTALIPAAFGLPVVVLGVLARKERLLKHAMHGAAMLAVLGAVGTSPGLVRFLQRTLGGAETDRPVADMAQAAMFALSAIFVVLCVRSFIAMRRSQANGES